MTLRGFLAINAAMNQSLLPAETGLATIASRYDVILCDVWGVLHNGARAWREAGEALTRFREAGGAVVLVSNAPRPSAGVVPQLDEFGVPRTAWDGFVSSGDMTREALVKSGAKLVHHIGPARDYTLFEDIKIERGAVEDAEIAVVTGLFNDETESPDDYRDALEVLLQHKVRMICANPDRVVERGGTIVWCAGAIADLYEEMGGAVDWLGKPYPAIYEKALEIAASIRGGKVDRSRVLAVGDAVRTDLAGANSIGVDCLFMTGGIHGPDLGHPPAPAVFSELLAQAKQPPVGWSQRLIWQI
ncbi:hydrolase [Agaricicola taiwanensis]|uniref:Hydrolase n=1 Tax=Agaricicola taiwanensis TaxID=591372 RepID=A0A8J2VNP2_9RHOB|nr:TIGR01459 family HAD-type hydrolase [Agaricicola taiwanensis]GGE34226.1 hydrolase [Agaricicola taiwanensis]